MWKMMGQKHWTPEHKSGKRCLFKPEKNVIQANYNSQDETQKRNDQN